MSVPAAKPYQMVPASTVINVRMSIPLDVNDGAEPPAQSTELSAKLMLRLSTVTINVKEPISSSGGDCKSQCLRFQIE